MAHKCDFSETLEAVNEGRYIERQRVQARALNRKVWISEWHIPGCLSESVSYSLTKSDAIDTACMMAETENGIPRGMKTALRKSGRFDCQTDLYGTVINTVYRAKLADLLA